MSSQSVFIKVFPTKSGRFRARVDYPVWSDSPVKEIPRRVEEITIGGMRWKQGHLEKYQTAIIEKMWKTMYGFVGELFIQSGNPSNIQLQNGNVCFMIAKTVL